MLRSWILCYLLISFLLFWTDVSVPFITEKRYKIYDHCQSLEIDEGEEIYKEGEVDNSMYVVVKGCIKQY